ncbi:MAG: membrane-bound lytic murein transglycosylase MltF [Nitrosospira sp.]|nr:membrane-bound lytic murein transglycosylase MltF [Nitrosospira sp.]
MHATIQLPIIAVCMLLIGSCDLHEKPVPERLRSDQLVVITVNSPGSYYEDSDGIPAGLEYDLVNEFAKELGLGVTFKVMPGISHALFALQSSEGHFATGLSVSDRHSEGTLFGPVYQHSQSQLVYNTDYPKPRSIMDIVGSSIELSSGGSHSELMMDLQLKSPDLKWVEVENPSDETLERLSEGKIDYAVSDSTQINLAKNFYPNLATAFKLGSETGKAWSFSLGSDPHLVEKVNQFFKRIDQDGTLKRLIDRHYGHVHRLDQMDVGGILKKMRTVLPSLRDYFHQSEELTGIDWRLIAALAYKESHWDRLATSPTNVRGIMMLTEATADRMNVKDRLDARQSILAGARYLLLLKEKLPDRIAEPDRTWIALAAYNLGYGHLEDARILSQRMGLSPDSWVDLRRALPLLSHSQYFEGLKHGYARGGEAVILAESVRVYHDILMRYERPHIPGSRQSDLTPQLLYSRQ